MIAVSVAVENTSSALIVVDQTSVNEVAVSVAQPEADVVQ